MEVQEQSQIEKNILIKIKNAYKQYKSDLDYVKNKSDFWKGKSYRWGLTHLSIFNHSFYYFIIK